MSGIKATRDKARRFAAEHLRECAEELREWQDTAILRDGRVRELAKICARFIENHDSLRVAESFINRAALDRAAMSAGDAKGASDE